jgi:hypothetical protein
MIKGGRGMIKNTIWEVHVFEGDSLVSSMLADDFRLSIGKYYGLSRNAFLGQVVDTYNSNNASKNLTAKILTFTLIKGKKVLMFK